MCDDCAPLGGWGGAASWSRRRFLTASAVGAGALTLGLGAPVRGAAQVEINPRAAWTGDSRPPGPLSPEPEVRFLLVHHTVNANTYTPDQVPGMLRQIHAFHTGPEKRWPDIAYNFIVDRFGRVWETRAGSASGPVVGDATGGNQGWDQKCAFLGDHRTERPSPAATDAMTRLLALLADRHGIDTAAGATTTFVSRGSNRWAQGQQVTTATITGHRNMSQTACPGDAAMTLVEHELPGAVTASRSGQPPPSTAPPPTTAGPATSAPTATGAGPVRTTTTPAPTSTAPPGSDAVAVSRPVPGGSGSGVPLPLAVAAGGACSVLAGLVALRARRGA